MNCKTFLYDLFFNRLCKVEEYSKCLCLLDKFNSTQNYKYLFNLCEIILDNSNDHYVEEFLKYID